MFIKYLHGHGQSSLFRISACQRHPGDVERVGEGAESLCPDNAKVARTTAGNLSEGTVEDVSENMRAQTSNHSRASLVTIRDSEVSMIGGSVNIKQQTYK
jgi:hypothetical protein